MAEAMPTRTDCERALRAAGLPSRLAKRVLAVGWAAAVKAAAPSEGAEIAELTELLRANLRILTGSDVDCLRTPLQSATDGAEPVIDSSERAAARNARESS